MFAEWDCMGTMLKVGFFFLSLLAFAIVSGCSGKQKEPIRIGITSWPGYDYLLLAEEKGLLEKTGITVSIVNYSSLKDAREAYERGDIDVLGCTNVEIALIRERTQLKPQAFLVVDISTGGDVLLSQLSIKRISDLKGKTIALEQSNVNMLLLLRALQTQNYTLKDITMLEMTQAAIVDAFTKKKIDAAVSYLPFSAQLLSEGNARILFDTTEDPHLIFDIFIAEQSLIENRAKDLAVIFDLFYAGVEYSEKHPDEADSLFARYQGLTVTQLHEVKSGYTTPKRAEQQAFLNSPGILTDVFAVTFALLKEAAVIEQPQFSEVLASTKPLKEYLKLTQ